jgi:hypothetical protein
MTETKFDFSFLKFFNILKGVHKVEKEDNIEPDWIDTRAPEAVRDKFRDCDEWCKTVGIERPKVKYPVLFGKGDNQYPGMMATDDIAPGEIIIKVPSEQIISTKVAYECEELKPIYFDHPELFGKHVDVADDNMLNTYVLY